MLFVARESELVDAGDLKVEVDTMTIEANVRMREVKSLFVRTVGRRFFSL